MPDQESHTGHPHGLQIAEHIVELEDLAGFPIVVVALEGWEQLGRKISHLEVFADQQGQIIGDLKDLHRLGRIFAEQQAGEDDGS